MRRSCTLLACALLAAALVAPAAHAELIAAYDHPGPGGNLEIALVAALTGEPIALPAGVNIAGSDNFHPSLSGDGRYLVLERASPAGTAYASADTNVASFDPLPPNDPASQPDKQVIMLDLHTGAMVQPTPLVIADRMKVTPSISADAHWLIHGSTSGAQSAQMSVFDVSAAPFVPPEKQLDRTFFHATLLNPALGTGGLPALAFSTLNETLGPELPLGIVAAIQPVGSGLQTLGPNQGLVELDRGTDRGDNHAAILDNRYVAYDQVPFSDATGWNGDAAIRGYDIATGQPVTLAPGLNDFGDARMPAWSADGRYLAYIHHRPDGGDDLLVYDFATGQFVNPTPTDLGTNPSDTAAGVFRRLEGNLSIADDPTLTRQIVAVVTSTLVCSYVPVSTLILAKRPTGGIIVVNRVSYVQKCRLQAGIRLSGTTVTVGFLVQRIVGRHRVLGRLRYVLKPVGRLPLGPHRGRFHVSRAFRFGRNGLPPGRYLITGRTFGPHKRVAGLATPRVVVVSAPPRPRTKH
jgi:WD40-like Beta Propeller Repeat